MKVMQPREEQQPMSTLVRSMLSTAVVGRLSMSMQW
jgi:hypothetical protein